MTSIEKKAKDLWVARVDAAVKGGERPPLTGWEDLNDDLKRYCVVLAGGIEKARARRLTAV
ncbi:MAG: hypothetical protein WAU42_08925 [Solirubrobacteraceae bacterium]